MLTPHYHYVSTLGKDIYYNLVDYNLDKSNLQAMMMKTNHKALPYLQSSSPVHYTPEGKYCLNQNAVTFEPVLSLTVK
ncbi:YagK/YfjJ domain-containing protein [Providencia stuartii]|uniref:YagK/YfjJ domain-containing protein n=1 Tax=Providencia stuartii TaxID=588 RepID=UPI000CE67D2D|nr:hypothetical protein AM353_10840 [Providencia stuartii]